MTLILKHDLDIVQMYRHTKIEVSILTGSKVIVRTDKHTDRQTDWLTDWLTHRHRHTDTTKTLPLPHMWEVIMQPIQNVSLLLSRSLSLRRNGPKRYQCVIDTHPNKKYVFLFSFSGFCTPKLKSGRSGTFSTCSGMIDYILWIHFHYFSHQCYYLYHQCREMIWKLDW